MKFRRVVEFSPISPMPVATSLLASIAIGVAKFYSSNQNTYLLHAVGVSYPRLSSDWLYNTADAFPVFSAVVRMVYTASGEVGLFVLTLLGTLVAFLSIATIAFIIAPGALSETARSWIASSTVLVLASVALITPFVFGPSPGAFVFDGYASQYLISVPGMLQPSDAGVMLLGAVALILYGFRRGRRWTWVLGAILCVVATVIHPTYLAPLSIGVVAAGTADLLTGYGPRRFIGYAITIASAAAAILVTNPVARATLAGEKNESVRTYFAFERVPHHTLISHWPLAKHALLTFVIIAAILVAMRVMRAQWLAIVITVATALALISAIFVQLSRSADVAALFPWRITVVIVPLSFTIIVSYLVSIAWVRSEQRSKGFILTLRITAVLGSTLIGLFGVHQSAAHFDTHDTPLIESLKSSAIPGTGLIPLDYDDIRLNAHIPVFVDWKSHPYLDREMEEWIRRIALVREAERDPQLLCSLVEKESIDWAVTRGGSVPRCLSAWHRSEIEKDTLLLRPSTP